MHRIIKATIVAAALAGGTTAIATPALAEVDFRFGIDIGPRYYHRPHYYSPYYDPYHHPHGRYYYYR